MGQVFLSLHFWKYLLRQNNKAPRDPYLAAVCPGEAQHSANGVFFGLVLKSWTN